jgi:hypothetical protein
VWVGIRDANGVNLTRPAADSDVHKTTLDMIFQVAEDSPEDPGKDLRMKQLVDIYLQTDDDYNIEL